MATWHQLKIDKYHLFVANIKYICVCVNIHNVFVGIQLYKWSLKWTIDFHAISIVQIAKMGPENTFISSMTNENEMNWIDELLGLLTIITFCSFVCRLLCRFYCGCCYVADFLFWVLSFSFSFSLSKYLFRQYIIVASDAAPYLTNWNSLICEKNSFNFSNQCQWKL